MKLSLRFLPLLSVAFLLVAISCNTGESSSDKDNASGKANTPAKASSASLEKSSADQYKEGRDYLLFERARIMDKTGFDQPAEAFSLLLPKGWHYEGEIIWTAPGSGCDGTNQKFKAESADRKFSFEMLPMQLWSWTSNPDLRQLNQNTPNSPYCSFGEPMDAEQYLRKVFGPENLGNPEITLVTSSPQVVKEMQQTNEKSRQELMRYGAGDVQFHQSALHANLQWPDGKEGIALCGVSIIETMVPNVYNGSYDKQTTSQALQRVVFKYPAGENKQAVHLLSVIMGSIRTNPSWRDAVNQFWSNVRQQKQIAHIGKLRMMDEQTRAMGDAAIRSGEARLKKMDMDLRNWEERQQSQDRIHTNFIKAIREVETYRDETGRVELNSGYDHAWSRGDGSGFIMSNNPNFDPAAVFLDQNWKEMKKVD